MHINLTLVDGLCIKLQIAVLCQELFLNFCLLQLIQLIDVICHVFQHDHIVQADNKRVVFNILVEDKSSYLSLDFLRQFVKVFQFALDCRI